MSDACGSCVAEGFFFFCEILLSLFEGIEHLGDLAVGLGDLLILLGDFDFGGCDIVFAAFDCFLGILDALGVDGDAVFCGCCLIFEVLDLGA